MQHSQNGWSMLIKTYQKGNFVWNFNRLMQQISTGYNWINWYFTRRTARCCSTSAARICSAALFATQAMLADLRKSTHPRPKKTVTVRHLRRSTMIYGNMMMKYDEIWWNMMKYDEIWWNMMKYDEIWWNIWAIWVINMSQWKIPAFKGNL